MADLSGWGNVIEDIGNNSIFTSAAAGMSFMGGRGYFFNMNSELNHLRAYKECAPLKAIIAKRAKAFNNGILTVVDKDNKPSKLKQATDILAKLENPNPLQTRRQFLAQMNSYIDLFGYCPLMTVTPVGRPDVITNIWCVPLWLFDFTYTQNWIDEINVTGIFTAFKVGSINILPENLKLIFDDGFGTDLDLNHLVPDSRLKGLDYDVSNIVAANKSNNTIITRRGPMGLLTNQANDVVGGGIGLPEGEKDAIQQDFARYGLTGQEYQVIISEANLKWQSMGYAIKDLMLQETINGAIMRLCDAYSMNYQLLSSEKSASYNDVKEFKKDFYQDGIIPEAYSRWEQLTKAFFDPNLGIRFNIDYAHIPALQTDMKLQADTNEVSGKTLERQFKNNVITLNRWLVLIGEDERTDKFGKLYYTDLIGLGFVFGNTTINGGDNLPTGDTATGNPNR